MFIIVSKSGNINIGANTYASIGFSDIAPEGYKLFCNIGYSLSAAYAHIYSSYYNGDNSWNFNLWNNSTTSANKAGIYAYFLCIKNSF